jgi:hypothetical protein
MAREAPVLRGGSARSADRRLLHGDGAGNRAGRAVEAQHQTVARGFHLAAAVFRDGLPERGEVILAKCFVRAVPSRLASSVEPTRSVKTTVTVSVRVLL